MVLDIFQQATPWVADISAWGDLQQGWLWHSSFDWSVLAQAFDTDVFKGTRTILNNFIKTGQLWAFLAGIVVGYIIRSATSYG